MRTKLAITALILIVWGGPASAAAPLYDPVTLNIGINCKWQPACRRRQLKAMAAARRFIARHHPPLWRIHLCNRNARRGTASIDWVGFDDCIRNPRLAPPRPR